MNIGCVVMASGVSSRFGGNKLLADFGGEPMLARTLRMLPSGLHAVVVTRSTEVANVAKALGFACVLHALPNVCDTIRLGLEALGDVSGCLFCVGDQPLLRRETIERMLVLFEAHSTDIVRAAYEERVGNPVLFPRALFEELKALRSGESGGAVIRRYSERVRLARADSADELEDVDTREALMRLQTKAKER